jgi:WD domain, G-beta repeat
VASRSLARFVHDDPVWRSTFGPDGTRVLTACRDGTARIWDVTWAVKLQGDALVRAVARKRLVGEGRLTEEEQRILLPLP